MDIVLAMREQVVGTGLEEEVMMVLAMVLNLGDAMVVATIQAVWEQHMVVAMVREEVVVAARTDEGADQVMAAGWGRDLDQDTLGYVAVVFEATSTLRVVCSMVET
jgi:hypothetical protein